MELKFILEAILFSARNPLRTAELRAVLSKAAELSDEETVQALKKTPAKEIDAALEALGEDHAEAGRSYRLTCVAGAWQFVTQPEFSPWLKAFAGEKARPAKLSQPALETLTIIAYRQPVTRAEIEQIRGVSVDGVVQTLLERDLIEPKGRAEVVGRPMTYGTTQLFLEQFGLRSVEELPAADELRRIHVERPPSLVTVDPGLATAPPDELVEPEAEQGLEAGDGDAPGADDPPATPPGTETEAEAEGAPPDEGETPEDREQPKESPGP